MESNSNNNNNGSDQHQNQQLEGNARKRKFNGLANDGDKTADEDQQQEPENCSKKNSKGENGNANGLDMELESLSHEDLVNLVRKLLANQIDAQKQLEATKNEEAEGSASTSKQAEEFSQRIVQLEQKEVEVDAVLRKKLAEIVEMHKGVEEKSKELAEKAKQIDALLLQLNESSRY